MKKKFIQFLSLTAIFLLVFSAYKIFFDKKESAPKSITCEQALAGLHSALKEIAAKDLAGECAQTGEAIERAAQAWQAYYPIRKSAACAVFEQNEYLDKKLYPIGEAIRQAQETFLEKNFETACRMALAAKADLENLKKENNIFTADAEMSDLLSEIEKLETAQSKAEIEKILPEIKYKFALLKQYAPDAEYARLISGMEAQIANLDKYLDGPDLQKAQAELLALFWKLYYGY